MVDDGSVCERKLAIQTMFNSETAQWYYRSLLCVCLKLNTIGKTYLKYQHGVFFPRSLIENMINFRMHTEDIVPHIIL